VLALDNDVEWLKKQKHRMGNGWTWEEIENSPEEE
jgi:hypothetical protein